MTWNFLFEFFWHIKIQRDSMMKLFIGSGADMNRIQLYPEILKFKCLQPFNYIILVVDNFYSVIRLKLNSVSYIKALLDCFPLRKKLSWSLQHSRWANSALPVSCVLKELKSQVVEVEPFKVTGNAIFTRDIFGISESYCLLAISQV